MIDRYRRLKAEIKYEGDDHKISGSATSYLYLVERMLTYHPDKRPSAETLLTESFFSPQQVTSRAQAGASQPGVPLQFYAPSPVGSTFYSGSRPSLDGNMGAQGTMSSQGAPAYGGNIQSPGGWWTAFGTGGLEGEPPLLEGA